MDERRHALQQSLDLVRTRITSATVAAARDEEPQLIVVTKFHPAADVELLAELGVVEVGENRDQEAAAKAAEVAAAGIELNWHFIGQLQSNKAKSVAGYAYAVHSVDRLALVSALSKAVCSALSTERRTDPLGCFIQVDLDEAAVAEQRARQGSSRGGAAPDDVLEIAQAIVAAEGLDLLGVMAVAPLGADPGEAFARLAQISAAVVHEYPQATAISAGMSGDLEAAIVHGATHLRVGSDVLGPRPALR